MDYPSPAESTTWYAVALGTLAITAVVWTALPKAFRHVVERLCTRTLAYVCPPVITRVATIVRVYTLFCSPGGIMSVLRKGKWVQPWTLKHAIVLLMYTGANVSCLLVPFPDLSAAAVRAGRLSLINLIVLYAGPYLSFLADIFGLSLSCYRRIHACVAVMSFLMAVFHVVAAYIGLVNFSLSDAKSLFALIAIICLALLCIPFPAGLKLLPYELVLRLHQLIAGLLAYACWIHIPPRQRFLAYVCAGVFLTVLMAQITLVLVPNCLGLCRAQISSEYGLIKLRLSLKGQPIDVQAGNYVNVWFPGLNRWRSWSFLQSHPFTVASWSARPSRELELLIKPQSGWTKLLLERTNRPWVLERWAFFTGPHGVVPKIDQYETILVLADQFKIISCMPFLREIVHASKSNTSIKWVHLCWRFEAETGEDYGYIQNFIDELIDSMPNGRFQAYSIISDWKPGVETERKLQALTHGRKKVKSGIGDMPLDHILQEDVERTRHGRLLILASLCSTSTSRARLVSVMNRKLYDSVDVFNLPG